MKLIYNIYSLCLFFVLLTSCGLDNVDAPTSRMMGKIVYNGQSIGLRGTGEAIRLQVYQDGYDLDTSFDIFVTQDGAFEATVFDGVYKIVARDNNGPWLNTRDTVMVTVKGLTVCDYPVTPYCLIGNESFSLNGNKLNASCQIQKIAGDKAIEKVMLFVSKTAFVDDVCQIGRTDLDRPAAEAVNLSMDISSQLTEKALFARLAVKVDGVGDAIYSKIKRIK